MTTTDLALTLLLFAAAVIVVTLVGFYFFIKWDRREKLRRGRQIAMARLDPEFEELPKHSDDSEQ